MHGGPTHFLAPPFGLPGERDADLLEALRDEAWADALTLLRDVVTDATDDPRWLLLLAWARYRDAMDVMVDHRLAASQEALALIDRALACGAPLDAVAPFRREVEATLDEESRAELEVLSQLPASGDFSGVPVDVLLDAGHRLWDAEPARAAQAFDAAARALAASPDDALVARISAGLCHDAAGEYAKSQLLLEAALTADWTKSRLRPERHLAEAAVTALLKRAHGPDFAALWELGLSLGRAHGLPFPSVWPNQEALLDACVARRDWPRARALAQRIEDGRAHLSRTLAGKLQRVRLEQV